MIVRPWFTGKHHGPAFVIVLDGIGKQVEQNLPEPLAVSLHGLPGNLERGNLNAALFRQRLDQVKCFRYKVA